MGMERDVGLTKVYVSDGMLQAMVIRGALESAGIPVMLSYESVSRIYPLSVGPLGRIEILVPVEWEEEARDLLETEPKHGEVFSVPDSEHEQTE